MQSGNSTLPTSFSQIPATDLMQHYFGTLNLCKKDSKRAQNLSLGAQSMKSNSSYRNNSKIETSAIHKQKATSSTQLPQHASKTLTTIVQNQGSSYNSSTSFQKPAFAIKQISRSSQSPIDKNGNKMKIAPQVSKQKQLLNKGNTNSATQLQLQQHTLAQIQNENAVDQVQFLNKENIHSKMLDSLRDSQLQQNNNSKQNSLTKKVLSINTATNTNHPKSARVLPSSLSSQQNKVIITQDNKKCNTLQDRAEMNYFITHLASKLQKSSISSNETNKTYNHERTKASNEIIKTSNETIKTSIETNKASNKAPNQSANNYQSNFYDKLHNSSEDNFTKKIQQFGSLQQNQLSTEANSLPYSSTDRSSSLIRMTTNNDEDDLQEQNCLPCEYHPTKKGKYVASQNNEGQKMVICSRCAIELASKGYKIEEIMKESMQNQMTQEMHYLLNVIGEKKPEHENVLKRMTVKREQLFQFYNKSASLVENTFLKLERQLMERKNDVLNCLNKQKMMNENTYVRLDQEAKDILSEFNQISSDILLHHDSILQSIEIESFAVIMQNYRQKIQIINDYFDDLLHQTIPLTKVSTEYPKNIIDQIFQVQHYQTTLLKKNNTTSNSNQVNALHTEDISNDLQNNQYSEESNQIQMNSINPLQISQPSQGPIQQEDDRAQVQSSSSSVYERIGFSQLLSQQQQPTKQNENTVQKDICHFNTIPQRNHSNNTNEQFNYPHQNQINNTEGYLFNTLLPISQTSSIMIKSLSNLASQFELKNGNIVPFPNGNLQSINNNIKFDDDKFRSPDIYQKNIRVNKRQSVNDTPIAGLNQKIIEKPSIYNPNIEFQNKNIPKQNHFHQLSINDQQKQVNQQINNNISQNSQRNTSSKVPNEANSKSIIMEEERNNNNNSNFLFFNEIKGQQQQQQNKKNEDSYQLSNLYGGNQVTTGYDQFLSQNDQMIEQKQQSGAFRTLFSQKAQEMIINEEPASAIQSSGKDKYKNILEKIHANQTRNNTFYQDIIRGGSVSPKMQNVQSPSSTNFITPTNDCNHNNAHVSPFDLQNTERKIQNNIKSSSSQQIEPINKPNFGHNFIDHTKQYEYDSNNFTINNSLAGEDDQVTLRKPIDDYNSTSKFGENNNNNNQINYNSSSLQEHCQLDQQNQNKYSESFAQCIQNYPTELSTQSQQINLSTSQSQQLQVVQKSYNQFFNNMPVRESFAVNSFLKEGDSSLDQQEQQEYLKEYAIYEQMQNKENLKQYDNVDWNNKRGINLRETEFEKQYQNVIQKNQFQNYNNTNNNQLNDSKESKRCTDFINFIETKIEQQNTNERMHNKSDFRKTLFFSPKFNNNLDDEQQQQSSRNQDISYNGNNHQFNQNQRFNPKLEHHDIDNSLID